MVMAGLDGEPVLRYTPAPETCQISVAEAEVARLLRQAGVRGARLTIEDAVVRITFRNPEVDNERYAHLKWHLARVSRRSIEYEVVEQKRKRQNPRAVLKSMLPEHCRITAFEAATGADVMSRPSMGSCVRRWRRSRATSERSAA
ncbi:MAG: hypothetical protein ABI895_28275 [Deltaproteobacteria bacterium]